MTNKNYNDFLTNIAFHESSGNPKEVNSLGFIGAFQMGEEALEDAGYYKRNPKHFK